jgi:hypothetical protein
MLKTVLRTIIFLLGVYEIISIVIILVAPDIRSKQSDFLLMDSELVVQEKPVLYLLLVFIFFLGLNRITWSVTAHLYPKQNNFLIWFNLVLLHTAELLMFWTLALMPHFNPNNLGLADVYQKALTLELGNHHSRDILVVVPLLLLMTILHGPRS